MSLWASLGDLFKNLFFGPPNTAGMSREQMLKLAEEAQSRGEWISERAYREDALKQLNSADTPTGTGQPESRHDPSPNSGSSTNQHQHLEPDHQRNSGYEFNQNHNSNVTSHNNHQSYDSGPNGDGSW